MEMLKFGKFAALSLALAVAVGCSSKGGDASGEGAIDPNAGYGANTGAIDGSLNAGSEEAALRAITTFYFEFDSSDLKPEAMRALDVHARDLQANGARVVLEGHADERGTPEYNIALGQRRADAVQAHLTAKGVNAAQVSTVSYGEEKPAVLGHTEAEYAKNRRAVLEY